MKRNKIIIILVIVLASLSGAFLLFKFFSFQNRKIRSYNRVLIKKFNKDNVKSIEISDYQDTFLIEKNEDTWFVDVKGKKIPGDKNKINNYLDSIKKMNQGFIRDKGNKPENDSIYGLDNENVQKVTLNMKGDKKIVLYVGSTGSKPETSFIRYSNEKKVREVNSGISTDTANRPVQWSVRIILENVELKEVDRLEIVSFTDWYKGNYTIQYKEKEGSTSDNFILIPALTGKKEKEYSLSNSILNLIRLPIDEYKLDGKLTTDNIEAAHLKLVLKEGKTYNLDIYKASENDIGDYIIDVDFNDYLYLVDEKDLKRIIKTIEEYYTEDEE